MTKIIDRFK